MRSLQSGLWVMLVLVPAAFASCSDDESGSADQHGGASAAGDSGHAGEAAAGASSNGGAPGEAGHANGGAPRVADGGEPSAGDAGASSSGGAPSAGDGGAGAVGAGGAPGGATSEGGAGGEGGAPSVDSRTIVLFDSGPRNGLNFGGRLGLDQHCALAKDKLAIPGAHTHALISVSATDELRDMPSVYGLPTNRAFVGPTGKKVADDFADLLDGELEQSLSDADISAAQFWITGSNTDGSVRTTCNGWTTSDFDQQVMGTYGYPGASDSSWLTVTGGQVYCSASQYTVICAAYD